MIEEGATARKEEPVFPLGGLRVDTLRTTFFWPLTLDRVPGNKEVLNSTEFLDLQQEWLLANGSPWTVVEDGLLHLPEPADEQSPQKSEADNLVSSPAPETELDLAEKNRRNVAMADAYGEFIYFHDFVQRMLFGRTGGKEAGPLRLFQRTDIDKLDVRFSESSRVFDVERVNLYILAYGVAVVSVQVVAKPSPALTLESALRINDTLRRSHVPYFDNDGKRIHARGLPEAVTWSLGKSGQVHFDLSNEGNVAAPRPDGKKPDRLVQTPYADLFSDKAKLERRVLPLGHWQWLLNGTADNTERMPLRDVRKGYRWRHFSDDRLPILSTVILSDRQDYYNLSEGHWMRLAFVDPPGSDPYPYAPAFLQKDFAKHCYDRFHHEKTATADEPTRYLMCDYAMTAVTYRKGPRPDNRNPTMSVIKEHSFAKTIEMHMQRHYYQMFLLQVIDKAVMLGLSSRITRAVERFGDPKSESQLSQSLQDIERDFLQYVHRFRFTGISGQLQATELHSQLRAVMGLDAIFSDIKTELETAVGFLSARQSDHAAEAAERLNIVASLGVVIALVFGFFSLNILTSSDMVNDLMAWLAATIGLDVPVPIWARQVIAFGIGLGAIAGLSWGLAGAIQASVGLNGRETRPAERFVQQMLGGFSLFGFLLAALAVAFLALSGIQPP